MAEGTGDGIVLGESSVEVELLAKIHVLNIVHIARWPRHEGGHRANFGNADSINDHHVIGGGGIQILRNERFLSGTQYDGQHNRSPLFAYSCTPLTKEFLIFSSQCLVLQNLKLKIQN